MLFNWLENGKLIMNKFSKDQLRSLIKARENVLYELLGNLSPDIVSNLLEFYVSNLNKNEINTTIEGRSKRHVPTEEKEKLSGYAQVYLQKLRPGGQRQIRSDYINPVSESLVAHILDITKSGFRMRLSSLKPGAELPRHIDDPEQYRAIALLKGKQDFFIETKKKTIQVPMRIGEVWFINTAWPHWVKNQGPDERVALLVDLNNPPKIPGTD